MKEVEFKLTGFKAVVVIVCFIIFALYSSHNAQKSLENSLNNPGENVIAEAIASYYAIRTLTDVPINVTEEGLARLNHLLNANVEINKVKVKNDGEGDYVVMVSYTIKTFENFYKEETRYFIMRQNDSNWSVVSEANPFVYYISFF